MKSITAIAKAIWAFFVTWGKMADNKSKKLDAREEKLEAKASFQANQFENKEEVDEIKHNQDLQITKWEHRVNLINGVKKVHHRKGRREVRGVIKAGGKMTDVFKFGGRIKGEYELDGHDKFFIT